MPEREISEDQLKNVKAWLQNIGAKRLHNIDANGGSIVWSIEQEPFVVHTIAEACYVKSYWGPPRYDYSFNKYYLLCSDKHEAMMEEVGVLQTEELG